MACNGAASTGRWAMSEDSIEITRWGWRRYTYCISWGNERRVGAIVGRRQTHRIVSDILIQLGGVPR